MERLLAFAVLLSLFAACTRPGSEAPPAPPPPAAPAAEATPEAPAVELLVTAQDIEARRREARRRAEVLFLEGERLYQSKDYEAAIESFDEVLEIIDWAPYQLDLTALRSRAENFKRRAQVELERYAAEVRRQEIESAYFHAIEEDRRLRAQDVAQIRRLFLEAIDAFEQREYDKAAGLAERVLELAPRNFDAQRLIDHTIDARHDKVRGDYIEARRHEWSEFREDIEEARIPYYQVLSFPEEERWKVIDSRAPAGQEVIDLGGARGGRAAAPRTSTFALDVDTASYTRARRLIESGVLPPAEEIRIEEFVNAIDHGYAPPEDGDFAIHLEAAPDPHVPGRELLRVGIQARRVEPALRAPADLVLVVDCSGSMDEPDRLPLVRDSLALLVSALRHDDRIALVTFSDDARLVLPSTGLEERTRILEAISGLAPEGSTNIEAGIDLAARVALESAREGASLRLVLCSDGLANQGSTGLDALIAALHPESGRGATLTVLGFGMEYADHRMEQLADRGDGACAFVDRLSEARRVLVEALTGTIELVARDAKIQVEFDPAVVEEHELLGYENREIESAAFRDDEVDAGEVGAGHASTALYRLRIRGDSSLPAATVRLRWRDPSSSEVHETSRSIRVEDFAPEGRLASASFRRTAALARFAEVLRGDAAPEELESLAAEIRAAGGGGAWAELADLVDASPRSTR